MFINTKIKKEDLGSTGGGSKYITRSGIYDVEIDRVSVSKTPNGVTELIFTFGMNGETSTIYGTYIANKAGDTLPGYKVLTQVATIAGLVDEDGNMAIENTEKQTHIVGKNKEEREFDVLDQFTGLPCKVRVQLEYSINPNTNQIQEKKVIKSFFREDGASADEILSGSEIGKKLAWETEKVADNITYKDGLTAEDVKAWMEAKKAGKSAPTPAAKPKVAAGAKSGGLFKSA